MYKLSPHPLLPLGCFLGILLLFTLTAGAAAKETLSSPLPEAQGGRRRNHRGTLLPIHLIRNYAVYPRTKSLEQVEAEYDYELGGDTADNLVHKLTVKETKAEAAQHNPVISDAASFTQAITAINNDTAAGQYTITLNGSFNSDPVTFTGNATKTITIKGDASVRTISNNGGGSLFTVPEGITLALDNNVTLDGNNKTDSVVTVRGGTLSMKVGSTVRGAQAIGVYVGSNNTFTMSGQGTFIMNGGTISGNSAPYSGGGVFVVESTFTMNGGTISGNSAPSGPGGGVGVYESTFTMNGGTITGNSASGSGGVTVSDGGFTMNGGTITGNSASNGGGAVGIGLGIFTMNGGTISGNSASNGGGVAVNAHGTFMMNGGTISGNSASDTGGGVYVWGYGLGDSTFIKNAGGTIDATNSALKGRVAYVDANLYKQRNTTAGPGVNLDSDVSGAQGGWE